MALPQVKAETIKDKLFSKTLSGEKAWRLIYGVDGEVLHLFESTGITYTPGTMKCFESNADAGVEIEKKALKCFKVKISNDKVVESLSELKIGVSVPLNNETEKIFYASDLMEFEMYAEEKKWDISKIKNQLPSATENKGGSK